MKLRQIICPQHTEHTMVEQLLQNPSSKGRKQETQRSHWSIAVWKSSRANGRSLIRFRGLGIILHSSWSCSPSSQFHPLCRLFFFMKGSTCLQPSSFPSLLPASRDLGVCNQLLLGNYSRGAWRLCAVVRLDAPKWLEPDWP